MSYTSQYIYYYVYQVLFVLHISTSLMKTSRRLITLILQKCVKHNSKYVMMCSINMHKVIWRDRVENKKEKEKGERKEIGRS